LKAAREAGSVERDAAQISTAAVDRAARAAKTASLARRAAAEADPAEAAMLARVACAFEATAAAAEESAAAAVAYCSAATKEARLAASAAAASRAMDQTREDGKAIEDVLLIEIKTAQRYLYRGKGLVHDFEHASARRRTSLIRGTMDNFVAVKAAAAAAEAADATTSQVLREANDIADALMMARDRLIQLPPKG